MDFNTETFAGSQVKKFRKALSINDMSVGEVHYILRWNGIKPLRYEKRINSNEKSPVYSRYEIECLFRNTPLMNDSRNEIMRLRKNKSSEKTQEKPIERFIFNNNPHYRTPEMEKASDELLKQQEVYFDDSYDDELYESMFAKKVFFTEEQVRFIKEKIENTGNKNKYIENDFNEKWERESINSDIFKRIKAKIAFANNSNLGLADIAKVDGGSHYIAFIHGGLNGNGSWEKYIRDIEKLIKNIPESYVIDLDVDVLDDVWTLQLGFHKEKLNEGAWGVEPEKSDSYLDLSHELGEPIIKILYKKLPKYVNNPNNNDGNIYYWLGLMLDMLKVKAFHESWLYGDRKDGKYKMIRDLFKCANKGFSYLLTDNAKDNRQGWKNFSEYRNYLEKMYSEFKKLENEYNMDKTSKQKDITGIIKENFNYVDTNKVLLIKKYLDDNFVRASMPIIDNDGYPKNVYIVGMKGADGEIARNMTAKQLFYLLQDKFQNIYADKKKRNALIKQTMIDWYNKKISNEGLLSKNTY